MQGLRVNPDGLQILGLTLTLTSSICKPSQEWQPRLKAPRLSLYKILFYFKASVWESILLLFPHPACKAYPIAILLHGHCAIYAPPQAPLLDTIYHTILVMAISCKGQSASQEWQPRLAGQVHVTLVTAASSGTHTRAMGWQAARPCADTGAPDNGMWIPERGLGDTDGISVTQT